MKKYRDLYEVEKRRFEEALQRYQEDHIDKVEIISLHKSCNKTGTKASTKTDAKMGPMVGTKFPRSGYHIFLREQLGEMTVED